MRGGVPFPLLTVARLALDGFGRKPVVVVDILQDSCANTYGVNNGTTSFCTAAGLAGTECFNTFGTCQDTENFKRTQKVVRLCKRMADVPFSWRAIPSIVEISVTPPKINAGGHSRSSGALGERGSITLVVRDHPHSDLDLDPYVATRPYKPLERGTFWTKWIARNPYYQNRLLRVRHGFLGQRLEEMTAHYYVLDKIDGPDSDGLVRLQAVDVLRLAGGDKAQWPQASKGVLQNSVTNSANTFTVIGTTIAEAGYDSPAGTLRIRGEVMTYTGISEAAGVITFTGVTRGTDGTTAAAHNAGDTVQRCVRYTNATPVAVLADLLVNGAKINSGAINISGMNAEQSTWLTGFELTTLLTSPVGVDQLVAEVLEQVQLMIWVDARSMQINMMAVRPPFVPPRTLTESAHIVKSSQRYRDDPEQRISQVWVWYQQVDPTKKLDDETNYREIRTRLDAAAEGVNQHGEPKVRKIFSRWLKTGAQVTDIQQRILARYRDNPKVGRLAVDVKDRDLRAGQLVQIESRLLTDATGLSKPRQFQILGDEELEAEHRVELTVQSYDFGAYKVARYMADAAPDYGAATAEQKATGAWYANDAGLLPDASEGYTYQ